MKIELKKILNIEKVKENFKRYSSSRILVIGDIILDHFIFGDVERISPEAPVPVIEVKKEYFTLGGAGNVTLNIKNMNGNVFLVSSIGKDGNGKILKELIEKEKIEYFLIERDIPTIIKTRVIARTQQIVRIDKEEIKNLNKKEIKNLKEIISEKVKEIESIVVSDYGKGFISKEIMYFLKKFNKRVIVDPKPEHFPFYKNVFCITPNKIEAHLGIGKIKIKNFNDIIRVGEEIIKKLKCENLLITLGKDGMVLYQNNKNIYHIPSVAKDVYDVTGAGDTVCGIFSLCLSVNNDVLISALISNFAAGIVVGKIGTATTNQKEFIDFFEKNYENFYIERIK
ncbi:MAG: PfkB family carbohydrate kinase [Candidatus Omnitrophica bacterium]|nr:PfkB family carbohydrate kinase [Candidatus Omnitrophota bacterium]